MQKLLYIFFLSAVSAITAHQKNSPLTLFDLIHSPYTIAATIAKRSKKFCHLTVRSLNITGKIAINGVDVTHSIGKPGPQGPQGIQGTQGAQGPQGLAGIIGASGPSGTVLAFAHFYALMPPDNAATILQGDAIEFPHDGQSKGGITRFSNREFELQEPGIYFVKWHANLTEAGQLVLGLDDGTGVTELAYTVVGTALANNQMYGATIVSTNVPNAKLSVRNPSINPTPLTITPSAGGLSPVSASLIIMQLM